MKRFAWGALAFFACAGGQARVGLFSADWEDDGGASIARVWARIGSIPVEASADVVVGVAEHGDRIVGLSLKDGSKWSFAHAMDSRPAVAGKVVVGVGGGELFALFAETGAPLWRRAAEGLSLLGAGDDGAVTAITLRRAAGQGSVLLAIHHDGRLLREVDTRGGLGAPAVLAGTAFVPWAGQYVSTIDLESGDETARVTLRTETSRAWASGGSLWFGEVGFTRFDEHIGDASRGRASTAMLPVRELPGTPKLMATGYAAVPVIASAEDKVRLYARPVPSAAGVLLEDGRWYGTYFRLVMAFSAGPKGGDAKNEAGKLAWVHLQDADLVGGAAGSGGILLCDVRGSVIGLDASTGAVVSRADLGEPMQACVVQLDGHRVAGEASGGRPLADQLVEAVLAGDPQLVVAQRLLLRELAAGNDEVATQALLTLASDARTSPALLADARAMLADRRNGASFMEAALARHYDFLKDELRPPPVGPIAQALGAMKEKAAAPLLAAHLLDPADTDDDVMRAAAALAVVAGPEQVPALRKFFGMYRATAASDEIASAVVSVGLALITVEGDQGRATVSAAAASPDTVPYARERLQALESAAKQGAGVR